MDVVRGTVCTWTTSRSPRRSRSLPTNSTGRSRRPVDPVASTPTGRRHAQSSASTWPPPGLSMTRPEVWRWRILQMIRWLRSSWTRPGRSGATGKSPAGDSPTGSVRHCVPTRRRGVQRSRAGLHVADGPKGSEPDPIRSFCADAPGLRTDPAPTNAANPGLAESLDDLASPQLSRCEDDERKAESHEPAGCANAVGFLDASASLFGTRPEQAVGCASMQKTDTARATDDLR